MGLCTEVFVEDFIIGYSDEAALLRYLEENRLEMVCSIEELDLVCVRARAPGEYSVLLDSVNLFPGVLFVEPDYQIMLEPFNNASTSLTSSLNNVVDSVVPDDPFWGDDPLTGLGQWNLRRIRADEAWGLIVREGGVVVSVIDTGIYYPHPDLSSSYLEGGYDWVNGDDDPVDDNGHGSWVAGIISAAREDGYGVAGISSARVVAEKVLDENGLGSISDLVSGIVHSTDLGVDVLSISLGTYHYSTPLELAVDYAYENGCVIVASAGNDDVRRRRYPAAFPNVLGVSATFGEPERLSWYSNYGPWINMSAPGGQDYNGNHIPDIGEYWILSCSNSVDGFMYGTGTSASTPHVSGVAALLKGVNPFLSNRDLIEIMKETSMDLGEPGWDELYGDGRVDAYQAVKTGMIMSVGGDSKKLDLDSGEYPNAFSSILLAILPLSVYQVALYIYSRDKLHLKRHRI